ncbi:DUF3387 domain-containing protein, partial [bacterium]|nr:DUF3387 domain-containing protein [bacterium]
RYLQAVSALSKAFALAVPHVESLAIRDEVGLFQEIRSGLVKATVTESEKSPEEMETGIRQLVSLRSLPPSIITDTAPIFCGQNYNVVKIQLTHKIILYIFFHH